MPRNSVQRALVLRLRTVGEQDREALFLGAEDGLVRASVYGGAKSKLRSYVSPGPSGLLYLYTNPVKDYRKVSDFDVKAWRPALREMYERMMVEAAISDTIITSYGGGGFVPSDREGALALAEESLDIVAESAAERCRQSLIRFFWLWAGVLGLRPALDRCGACDGPIGAGESAFYDPYEGSLYCKACASLEGAPFNSGNGMNESERQPGLRVLESGPRRWLAAMSAGDRGLRSGMDRKSEAEAWSFTSAIMTAALGRRLKSWDEL
jgi:DNA repair protein RecO (recombination protein O)